MSETDDSTSVPYDTQIGLALSFAYQLLVEELVRQGQLDVAPLRLQLEGLASALRPKVPETADHLERLSRLVRPAGGMAP